MGLTSAESAGSSNAKWYVQLLGAWLASYGAENTRATYRRDARVYLTYLEASSLDLLAVRRAYSPRALALVDLLLSTGVRVSEAPTTRVSALTSDRL